VGETNLTGEVDLDGLDADVLRARSHDDGKSDGWQVVMGGVSTTTMSVGRGLRGRVWKRRVPG
jgi:hypothetical protein